MKRTLSYFLLGLFAFTASAQQVPYNSQHLLNKFALSPAYAGQGEGTEVWMLYRQNWLGFDGAPETKLINANGKLNEKMSLGGSIVSSQFGIFSSLNASLQYAYHLRFAGSKMLSFGVAAGVNDVHVEIAGAKGQLDPALLNTSLVRGTRFDAGFGAVFRLKKLNVGFSIPQLLRSTFENEDVSGRVLYTLTSHVQGHLSYSFRLQKDLTLEPWVVMRKSETSPAFYEVSSLIRYRGKLWATLNYRKDGAIGLGAGAEVWKKLRVNYIYEFAGAGLLAESNGSHEVTLGYVFGKPATTDPKKPYINWE